MTVDPIAFPAYFEAIRRQFGPTVTRLRDEGALTAEQADDWWSWLACQAEAGTFTCTATTFAVTGTRPPPAGRPVTASNSGGQRQPSPGEDPG
jgi:hypothetical protein